MLYKAFVKPIFFTLDPEFVHNGIVSIGEVLGKSRLGRAVTKAVFCFQDKRLKQKIAGIDFDNPIGLSAGFDYNARLTQILPSVGFGFGTAGTVTNMPYEGNPTPRLGRLVKSKSLLVNKGFKSEGADKIIYKISNFQFSIPIGVSIGRTNSPKLKTLSQSIDDIVEAFDKFESSKVRNAYYELNISCPNLIHGSKNITFYQPKNLTNLLSRIDDLKLSKPLFIKMPISESNKSFEAMLRVISKHNVAGVIIGNLQKDRKNPSFDKGEIKKAGKGNFSGIPCRVRSNELIALAYQKYGDKLAIIGCGGVFDARDVYEKIKLGASLVMLITGMIFEGPKLVGRINKDLVRLIHEDGYKNISEAVGIYSLSSRT